jgi:hypothetical protein
MSQVRRSSGPEKPNRVPSGGAWDGWWSVSAFVGLFKTTTWSAEPDEQRAARVATVLADPLPPERSEDAVRRSLGDGTHVGLDDVPVFTSFSMIERPCGASLRFVLIIDPPAETIPGDSKRASGAHDLPRGLPQMRYCYGQVKISP